MELRKTSIILIAAVLGISLFFAFQLRNLRFNYELERFFPLNNESTVFFQQFQSTFGNDSDYLMVGLRNEAGIFDQDFLRKADSLYLELKKLETVEFILAPTRIREQLRNRYSSVPIERPWLHVNDESRYAADSARIYQSDWKNFLFAEDRQSIMLFVRHQDQLNQDGMGKLADEVRQATTSFDFEEVHYAGKCFGQSTYVRLIQKETFLFVSVSVVIVILFLWISYRKLWGIWMPLSVVALSILWTMGIVSMLGRPIDLISNIIPTLLLIIGIADVIHLLTHYLRSRKQGIDKWNAIKTSVRVVGKATLLTTLTTALGFLTLTSSGFISLIELGTFATVGLIIAFVLTYTFLPALIMLHSPFYRADQDFSGFWEKLLTPCFEWVMKNQRWIIGASLLVFMLGVWGASKIRVNNHILTDLSKNHPLQVDQRFFAEKFGGDRTLEIQVSVREGNEATIFSPAILKELEKVGQYLEAEYGGSNLISPAVLIAHANRAYHFGQASFFNIPDSVNLIPPLVRRLRQQNGRYEMSRLVTEDQRQARMRAQIPDWGSYIIEQKNEAFYQFLEQELPNRQLTYTITGTPHLIDLNNRFLAQNVLKGLLIALLVIALIFAVLFRSARLMLITLVPNVLPLVFIGGLMGFMGIDLKISTSIIFIIAFGIAVDDSIHFLSRFQREYKRQPLLDAVRTTYLTTGKAIVVTSLILLGGFMSFCLSGFEGTFYVGLLVSITLLVALIADLTILPVLLARLLRKK
jgi:predicted RND superfamily exporter protein